MLNDDYLIHMEDVYKSYDGKVVLCNIDLKVRKGTFITIVGHTGCGKSTLLRIILGSEKPTKGKLLFAGREIDGPDSRRGIVFQHYSLFPHLTVLENIIFGLELRTFSLADRLFKTPTYRRLVKGFRFSGMEYLESVGLAAQDADKYPHQLSGGMRQRVAIAQALIVRPDVVLMDEPFSALDDTTRQDMQVLILDMWKKHGTTIFFVTHDLEEAIFLGERIIVLSQYYEADSPDIKGAKIVLDKSVPGGHPKPTNFKYSSSFNNLLEKVRKEGLDPKHRQHISEFDLTHEDSFRTVTKEEWRRK